MGEATSKKQILVGDGLFTIPSSSSEKPQLIGSKCKVCGEVVFPQQDMCPNCCSEDVKELPLNPNGKLYSFTNVNNPVPGGYKGPIPYGVGTIELPDGVRVTGLLTEYDPKKIKPGMTMELVIEKLFDDDEGNEVIGFRFKPV